MKRLLGLLTLLVAGLAPVLGSAQTFIRGDTNGDLQLNIADPVGTLSWLYTTGGAMPTPLDAADANDNGVVEIADATYTLIALFQGGPLPPAPFPTPGTDTTPPSFPMAPSGNVAFALNTVMGCPGAQSLISMFITNNVAVEGFSTRITYDPALLTYDSASFLPIEAVLGGPPAFFTFNETTAGVIVGGVIPDFLNPAGAGLQPGLNQQVADLIFDVAAPTGTLIPVRFVDDAASSPPAYNMASVNGQAELAGLTDGGIQVSCMQIEYRRGDTNEDSNITITDVIFLIEWLFLGGPVSGCERTGDVNADGILDVVDIVYFLNALFLSGAPIAAPYPGCGMDTFASGIPCNTYMGSCP